MEGRKTGLILEGGAMRGLFTGGVMDVLMEHQIPFDGGIGVSAGALFGANYKSGQIGRVVRYNKQFCRDYRYGSFRSFLLTGDLYHADFCFRDIPERLDPFDSEAYQRSPMEFYVVCTDVQTGKPVYHLCPNGTPEDIQWMRASASMPLVSRVVEIGPYRLLDGGIADSVPVRYFEQIGYQRNVVILTQPRGYIKEKTPALPLMRVMLKKYPHIVEAMADRHIRYNETTRYIEQKEQAGELFVIRPPEPLGIGHTEKNPDKLERVYQIGRKTALSCLTELITYLQL